MTHGEDPSPETHKDSAVLTYLEGLLMHPVEVGPGATASGRSEGVHCNQEQSDKVRVVFQHHSHELTAPKAGTNGPTLGSSQHLKKARLLQSGAWNESLSQPMNSAAVDLNGQRETLQNGSLEASRNAGESTLLASLLQSFSSRLQSVAMSQQSTPPSSECTSLSKAPGADKESLQLYKSAAGHLKGLMRKSKHNNHSSTPYSPRGHSQDRPPESPKSVNSSTPPSASAAAESVSCAERLKAVANMVKIRSSPTASPKPSVACSQLALLLSSEAHFQQYSKVHALKAQFSGRCASERLAAIANQQHGQDKRPLSDGRTLSPITSQTGLATETATTTATQKVLRGTSSPPLLCGHSQSSSSNPLPGPNHNHNNPSREKRGFDARPTRPPQTCSSLLLLLLNNQNSQRHLTKNGHLEDNYGIFPHSCSSSVTSDSECSQRDRSLAKDNSDGESSHSSCSPMDLSVRRRAGAPDPGLKGSPPPSTVSLSSSATVISSSPLTLSSSTVGKTTETLSPCSNSFSSVATMISSSSSSINTSSLDKLTESLINKWKPEPSAPKVLKDKETEMRRDLKSPPKVTLMQLLLERRNTDMVNRTTDDQDLQFSSSKAANIQNQSNGLIPSKETRIKSPLDKAAAPAHALYSFSYPSNAALPSFSYLSPHVQSSPLDLCKSKPISPERAAQPAFSASKMLQNLAQSSSASPPILSSKGLVQDLDSRRPLNLLESPCATIHSTCTTPLSDRPSSCGTPSLKEDFLPSQIENLLEKRTVLQLLLGSASGTSTTSQKSRISSSGRSIDTSDGCYEKSEGPSIGRSSSIEPPFGMKFKTEVTQENEESSMMYEDSGGRKESSAHEKTNSAPDFCPKVKKEPQSTDTTAKYGLLSQLLKQQSAAYYSSSAPPCEAPSQARLLREEQYHVPSPKKRRLCYRQTDISDHMHPSKAVDGENKTNFYSIREEFKMEQETSVRKPHSDPLNRESQGFSDPLNRESRGFSDPLNRESQGFSDPLNRESRGFSDPLNRESQGFSDPLNRGSQGFSDPLNRGSQGFSDPLNRESQGFSDPLNRGSQGFSDPLNRESQGFSHPLNRESQGFSHPLNRESQGFSDPLNRGSQGFSDPLNRESQGFSHPLNRESQGFNVLKQLLLSDNCLKELSQQSHHTHGPSLLQANSTATDRHFSQPSYQQTLPHLRSRHPPGSHNSGLHLEPLLSPTTGDGSVGTLQLNQKQEPDTLIKQEPRSVDRWTSQENDEKGDSSLDSPQLSRSNPILYYMLQKGSIQLRKKVREAKGTHPESRIKEESVSEGRHYDHSLNSKTLHVKHSQESRGLS